MTEYLCSKLTKGLSSKERVKEPTDVKLIPKQLQQGRLALRPQLLQLRQPGALLDLHLERVPLGVGYLDDPGSAPLPGALQHLRQLYPCAANGQLRHIPFNRLFRQCERDSACREGLSW